MIHEEKHPHKQHNEVAIPAATNIEATERPQDAVSRKLARLMATATTTCIADRAADIKRQNTANYRTKLWAKKSRYHFHGCHISLKKIPPSETYHMVHLVWIGIAAIL